MRPRLGPGERLDDEEDVGVRHHDAARTVRPGRALELGRPRQDRGDDEVVAGGAQLDPVADDERPAGETGRDPRLTRGRAHLHRGGRSRDPKHPRRVGGRHSYRRIPGVMSGTSTVAGTSARSASGVPASTGKVPK